MKAKPMKNVIIVVAALLVIGAAGFGIWMHSLSDQIMDGDGMVREMNIRALHYYHGGGMNGDLYRIDMEDWDYRFTVTDRPAHNQETTEEIYEVDEQFFENLDEIVEEYDIRSWTDLPDAEIIAEDAPVTTMEILFSDGQSISVSNMQELPEDGWDAVQRIVAAYESCMERSGE